MIFPIMKSDVKGKINVFNIIRVQYDVTFGKRSKLEGF